MFNNKLMKEQKFKYFKIARDLNEDKVLSGKLKKNKFHFRGNSKSFSLISLSQVSPEKGKSGLMTKSNALKHLDRLINNPLSRPNRVTEEKNLQSYIIDFSINNKGSLPFGNYVFITSELAIYINEKEKIVNDILAITPENELVIVELKSIRDNEVKNQTVKFEKVITSEPHKSYLKSLLDEVFNVHWNGKIQKVAVWPKLKKEKSKPMENKFKDVKLYGYTYTGDEKRDGNLNERFLRMKTVEFSIEN